MLTRRVHFTHHGGVRLRERFPHLTREDLHRLVLTASNDVKLVAAGERWFRQGRTGRIPPGLVVRVHPEHQVAFLLEITPIEYRVVSVGFLKP